jgi:hypothetical protein
MLSDFNDAAENMDLNSIVAGCLKYLTTVLKKFGIYCFLNQTVLKMYKFTSQEYIFGS